MSWVAARTDVDIPPAPVEPPAVPFTYEFPRPGVTADTVLFAMRAQDLAVLLVKRKNPPYKGAWAIPGGFVNANEPLDRAAARELMEETGVTGVPLEQLGAFGDPGRDPRGHTITVAFYSFVVADTQPVAADDAAAADWFPLRSLPLPSWGERPPAARRKGVKLAFDHAHIIDVARRRLQERLIDPARESPFEIVPARFTLIELQRVYEAVLGRKISRASFRARLVARGIVEPVTRAHRVGRAPTSDLYRFKGARRA
jgi:8-oxo-dGTP diphosphatase